MSGPLQFPVQPPARPWPDRHDSPLAFGSDLGQIGQLLGQGRMFVAGHAPRIDGCSGLPWHRNRRHRLQRLAQGPVQMHRSGVRPRGPGEGGVGPSGRGIYAGLVGHRQVDAPADRGPVQAHLVNGLGRTPAPQLGRTVGGAGDYRDPGVGGFHHRGQVVGGRGAGGAHQHGRPARGPAQTEGEEPGGALVELDPGADPGVCVKAQGQRSRTRPRADYGLSHPESGQPGHKGRDHVVDGLGHDPGASTSLMAGPQTRVSARRWRPGGPGACTPSR